MSKVSLHKQRLYASKLLIVVRWNTQRYRQRGVRCPSVRARSACQRHLRDAFATAMKIVLPVF